MNSTSNVLEATFVETPAAPAPVAWVGVDVGKDTFDAAIWLSPVQRMREVPVKSFPRTQEGVEACLAWLEPYRAPADSPDDPATKLRVVMEATGKYSLDLAVWFLMMEPSTEPAIINPRLAKSFGDSLALTNRTDRAMARVLARYGAERQPAGFEPPTPERAALRDLTRYRQTLVEQHTAEENLAKEGSVCARVRQMQARRLRQLKRDLERIERELRARLEQSPELKADVELLDTIYGVGWLTAVTVLAELGDLRRFERARQLSAFAGLSLSNHVSGTSVRTRTHFSKTGSSRVRRILYLASLAAVKGDNDYASTYHRLQEEGKPQKVALGAVMRKILLTMRAMLVHGQCYQPHYRKSQALPCG